MAIERFTRMYVLIDGVTQVLLQNATLNADFKNQPVETMNGLAGFTPGAKSVTLSATSAVRISGPEFDAYESGTNDTVHEIQFEYGGKTIVSEGQIMTCSFGTSINASAEHQFEFMGTCNPPK